MIHIYIGYDTREPVAYHVCSNSIIRQSTELLSITPLSLQNLKNVYTETHTDSSTQFSYSRFLVPYLMNYRGWALFIDGDMLVKDDIVNLWNLRDDSKAAIVVKHNYKTKSNIKQFGSKNEDYPCKNWSSVILWNCAHHKNKILTPEFVQSSTGPQLHRFTWLDNSDIGSLPVEWNWLPDEFGTNQNAKLLHYTLGLRMSDVWATELANTNYYLT